MIVLVCEVVADLLQPTIVARIINEGVMQNDIDVVIRLGGVMLLVTLMGASCAVVRSIISSKVSQEFGADLRMDLFSRINRFSFKALSKWETAGIITRMTNDTAQLVGFTNGLMRVFVRAPALLIGAIVMTVLLNPRLAIILVVVVPVIATLMFISMKVGFPLFTKVQGALEKNNAVIREYLSGVRVVKAYNTFEQETTRFDNTNTELAEVSITAQRTVGSFYPIVSFAVNMSLVMTLWLARGWVANSQMQVGEVVAFLNYMMQISIAIRMIFGVYQMFIRAKASAERVGDILAEEDVTKELGLAQMTPDITASIEFRNVSFTYPGGGYEPVLREVSFSIAPGETLGIIGSTGSGKTTLVQLIPGFYTPTEGKVLIGEQSTDEIDLDILRGAVAYVSQQNTIFYGTIASNIRMGNVDATQEEIEAAARIACAHDFIVEYPDGYETIIGQKGVNLSGGQRQRVGIARALVRKAPILIMDDSVSALDVETEAKIMRAIYDLTGTNGQASKADATTPTCLLIAQRISSVMNLANILVMKDGRVDGFGNHEELMKSCKTYQEIYHSQMI